MGLSSPFSGAGFRLFVLAAAVFAATLLAASAAEAQFEDQYGAPVAPAGPLAGLQVIVQNDTDGVVNAGDVLVIPGEYTVTEGASVTLQDADATQGTLIDGQNAEIEEGSVVITVTADPVINAPGANGVLNTEGLFVVASTGIFPKAGGAAAAQTEAGAAAAAAAPSATLPETGGALLFGVLGGLALVATGGLSLRYIRR